MIPRLGEIPSVEAPYRGLLDALRASGFAGTISAADADRTLFATDNSIYQLSPQAVVFPRGTDDIARVMRLLAEPRFGSVVLGRVCKRLIFRG